MEKVSFFFFFFQLGEKYLKIINFKRTFFCTQYLAKLFHYRYMFPLHFKTCGLDQGPLAFQRGTMTIQQKSNEKMASSCFLQRSNLSVSVT